MRNPSRKVPVQTLRQAINHGQRRPDPQGSSATMHYITMWRNGRKYNLEVLFDAGTNTIWHFKYTRRAIGPLPAIPIR